jgi:hypothetical protein
MGNDILTIIKGWLVNHQLAHSRDSKQDQINDSITIPANAPSALPLVRQTPPQLVAERATAHVAKVALTDEQVPNYVALQWQVLALNRIMLLPGAKQSLFIRLDDGQVVATHVGQIDGQMQQLMVSPIIDKFALVHKIGLDDVVKEMVTTMTTSYEIVLRLTHASQFALVALFDRESTLLAGLMAELRTVVEECEYLSST